jgi:hypothetical protein
MAPPRTRLNKTVEFRLSYRGPLVSNGSVEVKQQLRRYFHPQLRTLWHQPPLDEHRQSLLNQDGGGASVSLLERQGEFTFATLVSSKLGLVAELDVLFLRGQRPGDLLRHGGDIDNRMKTLLDSLRVPRAKQTEIPAGDSPAADEQPFYCLLEDDALVTRLTITTDQLLEPGDPADVLVIVRITVKDTGASRFWSFV